MSEFPEWLEQEKGPGWNPSYAEAQSIHRMLDAGVLKPSGSRPATEDQEQQEMLTKTERCVLFVFALGMASAVGFGLWAYFTSLPQGDVTPLSRDAVYVHRSVLCPYL